MSELTSSPDPFAALGAARESKEAGPCKPRIQSPWLSSCACGVSLLLGLMAVAGRDILAASFLLSLSSICGLIAVATGLFRRIELRLIDIELALRARQ